MQMMINDKYAKASITSKKGLKVMLLAVFTCLTAGVFLSLTSCSDIDCGVHNPVMANYVIQGDSLRDTLTISALRDGKADTVLINRLIKTSKFSLPMSYGGTQDRLRFVLTNAAGLSVVDTITISKTNISHFESVDCAPAFFHKLTAVSTTGRAVSQININNPNVDYDGTKENIYLHLTQH